jgi:tetratricopeptide (TPR) repeat protein
VYCKAAVAALCLGALSCSNRSSPAYIQRIAILRFENLGADPSADWMGRAFPEILSRQLAGAPGVYAMTPARLHTLDAALGRRAGGAPGVSSERVLALAGGANRLAYGEYWRQGGRVEARLTWEDLPSGKTGVIVASGGDVVGTADAIARQLSGQAAPYATRNSTAIRAYVLGLEATDAGAGARWFEQAIAADPDYGPPYRLLAQWQLQQRDRNGAAAVFQQALARGNRMAAIDRAQLAFNYASLNGDAQARRRALADWARLTPDDPLVWTTTAELAMSGHAYRQAVDSYQKALAVQPDDPALLNQLGYASAYAGNLDTAVRTLERYGSLRPGDANPLDSLGDVNLLLGHLREAENFYLQAAKKDPGFLGGGEYRKAAMARLMTGDVNGAGALDKQYVDRRAEARDPLADYYRAEWLWISGSRKEAYQRLAEFAGDAESGPLRQAAGEAYAELAVWSVALGDRAAAARMAQKAGSLATPASANTVAVAQFLAQPSASTAEWGARADRAFSQSAEKSLRDRALAYALLVDGQFGVALQTLKAAYEGDGSGSDEGTALMLAWCYVETGLAKEAAGLLRFNPLPPRAGIDPFRVFYFPRLLYLRGRVAAQAGQADAAGAEFRLFRQLSGPTPLVWGEEAQAR